MENIFNLPIEGKIQIIKSNPLYPEHWFHIDEFLTKRMSCPFCEAEELIRKVYDICTEKTQCKHQSTVEDHSKYPHECPQCKGKAYIGLVTCECQNCGKFNLNY